MTDGALLTPWHLPLGIGLLATTLWIVTRHQIRRAWTLEAVPPGYTLGLVGVGITVVAVLAAAGWHVLAGPGDGPPVITGPFRLLAYLGIGMVVTCGYRAAWMGPSPARGLSLRAFTPILLPLVVAMALAVLATRFAHPAVAWRQAGFDQIAAGSAAWALAAVTAASTVLVTNLVLLVPLLVTLRRWEPPFGAVTISFGAVGLVGSLLTDLSLAGLVAAALAGGLVADLVIQRWPPRPDHPGPQRLLATLTPLAYWLVHFAVLAVAYRVTWPASLWLGAVALGALSGWLLAVVIHPAAVPDTAWAADDPRAAPVTAGPLTSRS